MAGGCSTEEQLLTLLSRHLLAVTSPVPALSHQPLTQEPPLIPALVSSIKRVERARVAAPLGWEREVGAQWDTHKNLMPLLCHAETTSGSLIPKLLQGRMEMMAKIWDTSLSLAAQLVSCFQAGSLAHGR